jgi:AbrB family looped-hinge helix DNA binding protein
MEKPMLITIDKRGSINLPTALRKELGLAPGACLDLTTEPGGALLLKPVAVYPTVRLSEGGLAKLSEARQGGTETMPEWLREGMDDAEADPE